MEFVARVLDKTDYSTSLPVLALGDKVRFAIRVGNPSSNVIDELLYKVNFPLNQAPKSISAWVKADDKGWQGKTMGLDLPANAYFVYVPQTTVYSTYLGKSSSGSDQWSDMEIGDVNGVSVLYGNGTSVSPFESEDPNEWVWTYMYFDMEVKAGAPQIPQPDLEMSTTVANISKGETLGQNNRSSTAAAGNTVRVRVWIHNKQVDSEAAEVKINAVVPTGSGKTHTITGSLFSSKSSLSDSVVINSVEDVALKFVPGSARIFKFGDSEGVSLTDAQAAALFSSPGMQVGDGTLKGCWVFQRFVEFELSVIGVGQVLGVQAPEVLPVTGPENTLATAALFAYLGILVRRLKIVV